MLHPQEFLLSRVSVFRPVAVWVPVYIIYVLRCEQPTLSSPRFPFSTRCQRYAALPSGCQLIQDPANPCCVKAECAPPTNGQCRDVKDNCFTYGKYACQAPYTAWARDNCAYYCGFCGEFVGTTVPPTAASVVSSLGQLCLLLRLLW